MYKVKFNQWDCVVKLNRYDNGGIRIDLVDEVTEEHRITATINVWEIEEDEVVILDTLEQKGMYKTLVEAGIISKSIRTIQLPFEDSPVCKILVTS